MMLGTKNVTELPQLHTCLEYDPGNIFWGVTVLSPLKPNTFKMLLKYLRGDKYFYTFSCSTNMYLKYFLCYFSNISAII
jgi:hypothetical protein